MIKTKFFPIYFTIICNLVFTGNLSAQDWKFIKERDGIRIFTRNEESNPVKSYKGEMDLHTTMEKIRAIVGNIESFDWWDESITDINVLGYEKEKYIRYYLIYDLPWPLSDRDLCVESLITNDSITGERIVHATPLLGVVPEKPDLVRIVNYWQQWVMKPEDNGILHVVLEGSVDPGGSIPTWLINMVIADTPLNVMRKVREQVEVK